MNTQRFCSSLPAVRLVALLLSLFVTVGCGSPLTKDIEIKAVADPQVQFSGLRTYAWVGAIGVVNDAVGLWAPKGLDIGAELKFLIDKELRARGYEESTNPDFLVALGVLNDVNQIAEIKPKNVGETSKLVGVGQGALLLEFIDRKSENSIWLGAAVAETRTDYTSEQTKKRLAYAVKQLVKQLPR